MAQTINTNAQTLLDNISRGDSKTLDYIYQEYFPIVSSHILKNSGTEEDAKDIFQEALFIVYKNTQKNNFSINCSLKTYIFAVSKKLWLLKLKRSKRTIYVENNEQLITEVTPDILDNFVKHQKYSLLQEHFSKLSDGCQQLLKLFFEGENMSAITSILGFKSEQYTRKRKFLCKEKLVEKIKNDPIYKELSDF